MGTPIAHTKLHVPPVRMELDSRPHLVARLDEGLGRGCRLVLISAPAGFGRTTLLGEWVHSLQASDHPAARIAWLSLDESNDDAARFLVHLSHAFETAGGIGDVPEVLDAIAGRMAQGERP